LLQASYWAHAHPKSRLQRQARHHDRQERHKRRRPVIRLVAVAAQAARPIRSRVRTHAW
jgi:hypothetical protein